MQDNIKAGIKSAMMAKEVDRLQVLRMISAAFTNELVAQGHPPTDPLSDEDAMKVIKKLANQRKDSINQFVAGGREDLAVSERTELAIIETMLPAQMTRDEIINKIKSKEDTNREVALENVPRTISWLTPGRLPAREPEIVRGTFSGLYRQGTMFGLVN